MEHLQDLIADTYRTSQKHKKPCVLSRREKKRRGQSSIILLLYVCAADAQEGPNSSPFPLQYPAQCRVSTLLQRQHMAASRSPEQILCTWQSMPGSWTLPEVSCRAFQLDASEIIYQLWSNVGVITGMLTSDPNLLAIALLPVQISLAATLLKVLTKHLLASSSSSPSPTLSTCHMSETDGAMMLESLSCLQAFVLSQVAVSNRCQASNASNSGSAPQTSMSAAAPEVAVKGQQVQERSSLLDRRSSCGNSAVASGSILWCSTALVSSKSQHSLHKLGAVLVIALAKLNHWRLRRGMHLGQGALDEVTESVADWLQELEQDHPQLGSAASKLFSDATQSQGSLTDQAFASLESQVWGEYALQSFQGLLLPGCCYLGCTNLAGVSEAALPTLLCSGCRRARYCSVMCQKAAWSEGGHSLLCCK